MSSEQIKPGYKRTEVGVIPEDWSAHPLGELARSITRGASPRPIDNPKWFDERSKVGWVRISDVTKSGRYLSDTTQRLSDAGIRHSRFVPAENLIMSICATVGRPIETQIDVCIHDGFVVFDRPSIEKSFLYYALTDLEPRWSSKGQTGSQMNLNTELIKGTRIAVPASGNEQCTIASALSDVDALLTRLDQLIAKKRDLKQAAMQQLLTGQTRLPGFSGEWEVKRLGSLGTTYGGLTGKTKDDFGRGDARYIPFMNVMTDTVIDPNWLEQVDVGPGEAQNITKKGDLFFNGSSETPEEVGYCSVLLEDIPNLYLNSFCFGFRFNPESMVDGLFFAYWFRCEQGRKAMSVLAQGATRYNISKTAFLQLEIPQPSSDEQTAIAAVLSDMDAELAELETRRDKTRALKQGMMQELLTGRIRLV